MSYLACIYCHRSKKQDDTGTKEEIQAKKLFKEAVTEVLRERRILAVR